MPDSEPHPGRTSFHREMERLEISERPKGVRLPSTLAALAVLLIMLGLSSSYAQAPARRFVVVLDAAHGGTDLGGRLGDPAGQTQLEKSYTLAMSVRLRSLLAARGISVVTTRESDTAVDSDHRAEVANRANAQACITLHASESSMGVHIYASSLSPVAPSTMLPWKTAQAAWVTRSLALAGVVNSALANAGLNVGLGRTDLPTIDCMACPALAIEIGRENSTAQSGGFNDADYQARIAQALAAALLDWKANGWRASTSVPETAKP